jgi:DNA excision repair protein ERCC-3
MSKITLANKLYVPEELVQQKDLLQWYYEWTENVYELEENELGEVVVDELGRTNRIKKRVRHSFRTYREVFKEDGGTYIALPRGNLGKISKYLTGNYRDLRPLIPIGLPLRMRDSTTSDERWGDQKRCIDIYMQHGSGIIEGDTGSGKTVVGTGILCELGMTTLIMCKQIDGIQQWMDEIRLHTNIDELEEKYGKKLLGVYKTKKDPFPITISTVQAFLQKNGRRWLRKHRSSFSFLLLDEVHDFGSQKYAQVVQRINPFAILGLTATTERRDQRHHLLFDIVGPVVAKGTARQMPPTVYFISTGTECPTWQYRKNYPPHYQFKVILDHIVKDKDRYEVIRKFLQEDADNKRYIACIAPKRTAVAKKLHLMLSQDGYSVRYVDGSVPQRVRKEIYREMREGKIQILFAGAVLNQLVNLPRIDCLHYVTPAASKKETTQAYGRARRWLKGKKSPIIRDYVDEGGGQLEGGYNNRLELCRANGWSVKLVKDEEIPVCGITVWKRRGKKKTN